VDQRFEDFANGKITAAEILKCQIPGQEPIKFTGIRICLRHVMAAVARRAKFGPYFACLPTDGTLLYQLYVLPVVSFLCNTNALDVLAAAKLFHAWMHVHFFGAPCKNPLYHGAEGYQRAKDYYTAMHECFATEKFVLYDPNGVNTACRGFVAIRPGTKEDTKPGKPMPRFVIEFPLCKNANGTTMKVRTSALVLQRYPVPFTNSEEVTYHSPTWRSKLHFCDT
jgi:hypothetical protein